MQPADWVFLAMFIMAIAFGTAWYNRKTQEEIDRLKKEQDEEEMGGNV